MHTQEKINTKIRIVGTFDKKVNRSCDWAEAHEELLVH